ncbi:DUF2283 domain-containing protein [Candidatus Woesearchaeota archaeon]|nr:DUF2283 domain-containing protein [Candidatus Woesearchaeota archaeon]
MVVGKNKLFTWDYSEKSDILNIHKAGKKTEGSSELGDFTVDFDKEGNVVGIEIINASEFFDQSGISKEQLEHLKTAQLMVVQKKTYMLVWAVLVLPENIERKVLLPTPILSESVNAAVA